MEEKLSVGTTKKTRVGYFLSKSKIARLPWQEIISVAESRGMELVPMNLDQGVEGLEALGELDLIITKITDDLVRLDQSRHFNRIQTLEKYLATHPSVVDIEPLQMQRAVVDRQLIAELVSEIDTGLPEDLGVRSPHFVIIKEAADDYTPLLQQANVKFPVMVKTVQACGSGESHDMGVIFKEAGLHASNLKLPLMVQEYYNHNSCVFKVFALEDTVQVVRRPSLRNVRPDESESLLFNSQVPLPSSLYDPQRDGLGMDKEAWADPPMHVLHTINRALRQKLGLALLGFDVVTQVETGKHAVIDVNYFPGYGGISNFAELFIDFLESKLPKNKK